MRKRALWFSVVALAACGDNNEGATANDARPTDARPVDAAIDTAPPIDANPSNADYIVGGAASAQNNGVANSLLWDGATLYLTDSNSDAILTFKDDTLCCGIYRTLPAPVAPAGVSLGDMVKNADGSILLANFGFGTDGTLFNIPTTGAATRITGLDPARRRIGLAKAPDGTLYESYFTGGGGGMQTGGVSKITIAAGVGVETIVATEASVGVNFKKLVGLVATNDAVFVAQQGNPITTVADNTIFKIAIPSGTVSVVATNLPATDLLTMLPNGDLLTGGAAKITRVTQAGVVTDATPAGTFEAVHGLAFDATKNRLFFINHSKTVGTPDKLHIRPFTP